MRGYLNVRFSELFADTLATHGVSWAAKYYKDRGMGPWEFLFWMRVVSRQSHS